MTRTGETHDVSAMFGEESLAMFESERVNAAADERAQWDREADDARIAVSTEPSIDPDPIVVAFLVLMVAAEDRGLALWDEYRSDWYLIKSPTVRTAWSDQPLCPRAMTQADLGRFRKVRSAGLGRWMACCPAHDDRNPSLSIRFTGDRWLFHCHAQACAFRDIIRCAGLTDVDMQVSR